MSPAKKKKSKGSANEDGLIEDDGSENLEDGGDADESLEELAEEELEGDGEESY